jgi:SAM-dependent methyltransferase
LVSTVVTPFFEADEAVFCFLPMDSNLKDPTNLQELKSMSKELPSYIHKPFTKGGLMLDLGCGDASYRLNFEHLGFNYVGLDYSSEQATLLGDAHALPFKDESFELVFSRSVFEHLQYPFVAVDEAYRVLKPNCRFLGSVAFLEPFHGRSFYHPTHFGLFNYFKQAGFSIEYISPNPKWDVLTAQAAMSLFPKLPRSISNASVFPLKLTHKAYWKLGNLFYPSQCNELTRLLWTTGSYEFVVRKN